jgi:hypothetical protein
MSIQLYSAVCVEDATNGALDWLAAKAIGRKIDCLAPIGTRTWVGGDRGSNSLEQFSPTRFWHDAGPIIEKYCHNISQCDGGWSVECSARDGIKFTMSGPTLQVAAMKAFAFAWHGARAEVPVELIAG